MNNITRFLSLFIVVAVGLPLAGSAADKKAAAAGSPSAVAAASPAASVAAKGPRPIPFHGMVSSVDQSAKTFTLAGKLKSRVFKVTDKTQLMKGASEATIKDIAEKQEVSGSYWKGADGSLEAKTVKIGPMTAAKPGKADTSAKSSPSPTASPSASPKKKK